MVEFFLPQQSLTPYQALSTYTREPARMLGEEKDSGTLEVGKKADFCVMKKDFCRAEPGGDWGILCGIYGEGRKEV